MATWNPVAIYGAIAAMSDADLLHWALTELARDTAHRAGTTRDPARIGNPDKPRLPEAAAYQAVSDRLTPSAPGGSRHRADGPAVGLKHLPALTETKGHSCHRLKQLLS